MFKMKKLLLALSVMVLMAGAGLAQKNKKSPDDFSVPEKTTKNQSASGVLEAGTSLEAELQQTLDVRKLSAGDQVVLKVTETLKKDGTVIVPKGSKLIGRVTQAQEKTKTNGGSKIGLVFESIVGKNLNIPLNATISSIIQGQSTIQTDNDLFASGESTSSAVSSSSSGGGLLGGVGNVVGSTVNGASRTVGGVTDTAISTGGRATTALGGALNGIQIVSAADGSAGGTAMLSSANKNIRLEKGVRFQVLVNGSTQE